MFNTKSIGTVSQSHTLFYEHVMHRWGIDGPVYVIRPMTLELYCKVTLPACGFGGYIVLILILKYIFIIYSSRQSFLFYSEINLNTLVAMI